jgi:GT2 family glycosyltransferase
MSVMFDVVTVYHRDENYLLAQELERSLTNHEQMPFNFIGVDNRKDNRGFAKGCNVGAREGSAPLIAFLNPDVEVEGSVLEPVLALFSLDSECVITGENFNKSPREYQRHWGCVDWVCGAAMFVRRDFWTRMAGFDERFIWGWEETDLIRRAQEQCPGRPVRSIRLPIRHSSPSADSPEDVIYKNRHFDRGARLFGSKWKARP